MAIIYSTSVRNARLQAVADAADAGSGAGKIRLYTSGATLLAELEMSDPSFNAPANGVMSANTISSDTSADATGVAATFDMMDSNNGVVMSGTVGATSSGADLEMNSPAIQENATVSITGATITESNS